MIKTKGLHADSGTIRTRGLAKSKTVTTRGLHADSGVIRTISVPAVSTGWLWSSSQIVFSSSTLLYSSGG